MSLQAFVRNRGQFRRGRVDRRFERGQPGFEIGLRNGDVIIEFDGKPVKTSKQLTEFVADTPVGKAVKMNFVRDGESLSASITLAERPGRNAAGAQQQRTPNRQQQQQPRQQPRP